MVRALVVERDGETTGSGIRDLDAGALGLDDPAMGDVVVDVAWSGLNFKDGLALAGSPGVMRVSSLVPGIDLTGTVVSCGSDAWTAGDEVVLTGAGLGETRHGGYAAQARVPGELLVRVPPVFGTRGAAAIGTAGFTAAQAVLALERHGIPDGPVIVTGATGGVGSIGVALLARAGREVVAVSGKPEQHDLLGRLGAVEILPREELADAGRPLQQRRWAGALDGVGGAALHNLLAQTMQWGAVAAYGLVGDARLDTTVQPFILRGVSLLGINSVEATPAMRRDVWARLERDLDPALLDELTAEVGLDDVAAAGADILHGRLHGRTVVRVRD
jgi:acrylyl-CoA reductase (NADPH)